MARDRLRANGYTRLPSLDLGLSAEMRILACPVDREGSGRYRMGLPIAALQKQESTLEIYLSEGLPLEWDRRTGRTMSLAGKFDFDVVVVQRPMSDWQVQALRDCRARGIRTIIEIDDDYESLHYASPAWVATHPVLSPKRNRRWLRIACREADLVTVTTPALAARYAPHGRVAILPNYVPEQWLSIETERFGDVVGWTGTVATHQEDLAVTRGGVAQAIRETGARFRVIGHPELVKRDLALDDEPECVAWQSWGDYPHAIAQFDVGIAPLSDTAFSRCKSAIKPLEYAALGVPSVVSPLPSYGPLARRGVGILAGNRSRDWRREVKRLLGDDSYRAECSALVREVASEMTIEEHAYSWAEAWTETAKSRRTTA